MSLGFLVWFTNYAATANVGLGQLVGWTNEVMAGKIPEVLIPIFQDAVGG